MLCCANTAKVYDAKEVESDLGQFLQLLLQAFHLAFQIRNTRVLTQNHHMGVFEVAGNCAEDSGNKDRSDYRVLEGGQNTTKPLQCLILDVNAYERDHLFVTEAQVGKLAHPLAIHPKALLILLADVKLKRY